MSADFSLPAESFDLRWLRGPAGVVVTSVGSPDLSAVFPPGGRPLIAVVRADAYLRRPRRLRGAPGLCERCAILDRLRKPARSVGIGVLGATARGPRALRAALRLRRPAYSCTCKKHAGVRYLVLAPRERARDDLWVLVFLHGKGHDRRTSKGLFRAALLGLGLPRLAYTGALPVDRDGRAYPFLLVCPQSPSEEWRGHLEAISEIAERVMKVHGSPKPAWFATGISMGANAAWTLAHDEERVAAIVPVSLDTWFVGNMRTCTPAWVFAGEHDEHESYRADRMEKALESVRGIDGTRTKFRCVPGGGHNRQMWNDVYKCSDLYEWLLERAPQ